jgi:hypothetical protein
LPQGEGTAALDYIRRETPYAVFDSNDNTETFKILADSMGFLPEEAIDYLFNEKFNYYEQNINKN